MHGKREEEQHRSAWRRQLTRLMIGGLIGGALVSGIGFAARLWWPFELFCHFRVQYFFGSLVVALGLFALRRFKTAIAGAALAGLNLVFILPIYFGPPPSPKTEPHLRAIFANVNTANADHQAFIRLIRDRAPDFFLALEVDDSWLRSLEALQVLYPYRIVRPRDDNFGIAFFSRLEPDTMEIRQLGGFPVPAVLARLKTPQGPLGFIGVHPPPPAGARYAAGRNAQLSAAAAEIGAWQGARMLAGDLNMTSWSPFFSDLLSRSGLRDSRRGFGIEPSWPDGCGLLGIPIDHCLVSEEIEVLGRETSASIGSDHYAVIVDLRIAGADGLARKP